MYNSQVILTHGPYAFEQGREYLFDWMNLHFGLRTNEARSGEARIFVHNAIWDFKQATKKNLFCYTIRSFADNLGKSRPHRITMTMAMARVMGETAVMCEADFHPYDHLGDLPMKMLANFTLFGLEPGGARLERDATTTRTRSRDCRVEPIFQQGVVIERRKPSTDFGWNFIFRETLMRTLNLFSRVDEFEKNFQFVVMGAKRCSINRPPESEPLWPVVELNWAEFVRRGGPIRRCMSVRLMPLPAVSPFAYKPKAEMSNEQKAEVQGASVPPDAAVLDNVSQLEKRRRVKSCAVQKVFSKKEKKEARLKAREEKRKAVIRTALFSNPMIEAGKAIIHSLPTANVLETERLRAARVGLMIFEAVKERNRRESEAVKATLAAHERRIAKELRLAEKRSEAQKKCRDEEELKLRLAEAEKTARTRYDLEREAYEAIEAKKRELEHIEARIDAARTTLKSMPPARRSTT